MPKIPFAIPQRLVTTADAGNLPAIPEVGWRYFAERLNGDGTSTLLHPDLELRDVSITRALSGPGGLSCSVSPENLSLMGPDGRPIFREWSTAIWAELDGVLIGGGVVDHIGADDASLSIECVGHAGYLRDMPYVGSIHFVQADPADIARHIWRHVQGERGGNLGVTLDQTKTPVRIGTVLRQVEFDSQDGPVAFEAGPYKLEWWQTHNLMSNFDTLAAETPFEYLEELSWNDNDTVRKHIRIAHPTIGTRRHELRFAIGENIHQIPGIEFSGEDYANGLVVLGAGEGRTMVRGAHTVSDGRLRRVAVIQDKQASSRKTADARAKKELALRRGEFGLSDIVVRDHSHAPFGSWDVGDEILLEGDLGWVDNEEGVWVRVVSLTVSPDEPDSMAATVIRTDRVES